MDEPGEVPQQEVATKEEVQKLTDEISHIKELLRTLTVAVLSGSDNTPTGETSRKAHHGSEADQEDVRPTQEFQHGIGAGSSPAPVKVSPPLSRPLGRGRVKRARMGSLEEEDNDSTEARSTASRAGRKRSENLKPDTLKVFKFDGTDYQIWSKAMQLYLDGAGLWEVVSGEDVRPDDPEDLEDWRLANTKACNVLFSSLTREQQKNVVNCDLATEMWKTLREIYARKSMVNQARLIQEYEDYHMQRGVSMQKYIADIQSYIGKLRAIGVDYPDKTIVLKVLRGLSEEYSVDRKILFNQDNLTFEEVCSRLQSEALMSEKVKGRAGQGSSQNPHPHPMANTSQGSYGYRSQPQGSQPSGSGGSGFKGAPSTRCFICRDSGHLSLDCPYKSASGEKVYICYLCKQSGHVAAKCPVHPEQIKPQSARTAGKMPESRAKAGSSHMADAMDINEEVD